MLQPWGRGGLTVLPSGTIPPNPSELLGSDTMIELLAELRKSFDMIIIDTPPLLPVTDAAVASRLADGAVVIVRYGKTTRNQVNTSVRSLQAVDARVLGFVLTMAPAKGAEAYSAYGYYAGVEARAGAGAQAQAGHGRHGERPDAHRRSRRPRPRPGTGSVCGCPAASAEADRDNGARRPRRDRRTDLRRTRSAKSTLSWGLRRPQRPGARRLAAAREATAGGGRGATGAPHHLSLGSLMVAATCTLIRMTSVVVPLIVTSCDGYQADRTSRMGVNASRTWSDRLRWMHDRRARCPQGSGRSGRPT